MLNCYAYYLQKVDVKNIYFFMIFYDIILMTGVDSPSLSSATIIRKYLHSSPFVDIALFYINYGKTQNRRTLE